MPLIPNMRLGAHVELFHEGEDGRKRLVHTSRPCPKCGGPLTGAVAERQGKQVHIVCPEGSNRGS